MQNGEVIDEKDKNKSPNTLREEKILKFWQENDRLSNWPVLHIDLPTTRFYEELVPQWKYQKSEEFIEINLSRESSR